MDYSDLVNQLRNVHTAPPQNDEEDHGQTAPVGMARSALSESSLEAYLNTLLKSPPNILRPRANFQAIPALTADMEPEVKEFKDDTYLHEPAVMLNELTPNELCKIGRYDHGQTAPVGMARSSLSESPLEAYLNALLKQPPTIIRPLAKFQGIPGLTANMEPEVKEFKDDTYLHEPAVILNELTANELCRIGRYVFPQISSGFTQKGVGGIFVLAYNLKNPTDDLIICSDIEGEEADVDMDTLPSNQQLYGTRFVDLPGSRDELTESREYCFLAASLLKMFTKSEENYMKSFTHTVSKYQTFYGVPMKFSPPAPTIDALKTLTYYFSNAKLFKMTLYRFLYAMGDVKTAFGLRRFLYDMHLANTGMHIVNIATQLTQLLGCHPHMLFEACYSPEFEAQYDGLATMFNLAMNRDEEHIRQMWRFGRLFDKNFMVSLQTKACARLVYFLAAALKKESPVANRDILSIAQLADLSTETKLKCETGATIMLKDIRATRMAGVSKGYFVSLTK